MNEEVNGVRHIPNVARGGTPQRPDFQTQALARRIAMVTVWNGLAQGTVNGPQPSSL